MAGQSITFDFLSRGAASLARDFRSIGDDSALSSRGVKILSDVIKTLGDKEDRTAAESKILAGALRQTGDAADRATAKAVLADAAIRRLGDSMQDSSKKGDSLGKTLSGLKMNPGLAGPALALAPAIATLGGVAAGAGVALAGAFVAGGAALAAFGAVAKPVLADAKTAATAAETAQNAHAAAVAKVTAQYNYAMSIAKTQAQRSAAYAAEQKGFSAAGIAQTAALAKAYQDLSPAQIALSKQIGAMADAWQKVKQAQTPVVAGALQPWLASVTSLTRQLGPIIASVSGVLGSLGSQFNAIISSAAFTKFRDFIANTGSRAVGAAGNALLGLFQGFIIILPKFQPLIEKAITWLGNLGPAIEKWASSKKTADAITAFMGWFTKNGPQVGTLLQNIGGALKALAPGLTAGGATQLKVISDFFGLVAKLPASFAKPLAETAAALLIMNKLGVVSVGFKLLGMDAAAAVAGGGAVGLWGKILPGVRLLGGALAATVVVAMVLKSTSSGPGGKNWWDNPGGADPASKDTAKQGLSTWAGLGNQITQIWDTMWQNTITRTAKGFHDLAGWFDTGRHWIAASWSATWADVQNKVTGALSFLAGSWQKLTSGVVGAFNAARSFITASWAQAWAATRGAVNAGLGFLTGSWQKLTSGVAAAYGQVKTSISNAWSNIWTTTRTAVTTGISDVVRFFTGLPGKITAALGAAGKVLFSWGSGVISGLLSGITSVWQSVVNFFLGVPKAILHALGIKSPPDWAIDAGKHIMNGIGIGVDFAKGVVSKATAAAIAAAVSGGVAGPGGGAPAANAALARKMMPAWGSGAEWAAWNTLMMHESGWNQYARNPSSGAYGIPQALPASKMGPAANPPQSNPAAQISWMIGYIKSAYGDPIRAWAQYYAHPGGVGYYDRGGWLMPGVTLAVNSTGRPERVVPPGGDDDIKALLERIHWAIRGLTDVAAAIPARTGQHVAAGVNSAGADAAFRRRYPG